jgi:hypothetical protein
MTEIIAILALLTSMMLLIVHYKNQVERRHGEITRLRSDYLRRSASIHQRLISVLMHLETGRIELRHIPDCEGKYNAIERMPKLIDLQREAVQRQGEINDELKSIDTTKSNKSKTLLLIQSMETSLQTLEDTASNLEQEGLVFLETIRSKLERE